MIFYKKRSLGELVSDSLNFFKEYGANFLKNYIALCGGVIILILIIVAFAAGNFVSLLLSGNSDSDMMNALFAGNSGLFGIYGIFLLFLLFLLGCISYAMPILYMQTASEQQRNDFKVQEIFNVIKSKFGRIAKFLIISFLLAIPIALVLIFVFSLIVAPLGLLFSSDSGALMVLGVVLGIIILVLFTISVSLVFTLSFNYYILNPVGFFEAIGKAFSTVFSKNFKKYILSILLSYLLIFVLSFAFGVVLGLIIGGASLFGISEDSYNPPVVILASVISYVISFILQIILSNLIYINIGFIYYDSREDLHREVFFDEIDTIGSNA
uniref:hypothetical protein n=1 Tax=Ornithobacterium rhinotracheale TaxID=28251 RepID=UPI0039A4D2C9